MKHLIRSVRRSLMAWLITWMVIRAEREAKARDLRRGRRMG